MCRRNKICTAGEGEEEDIVGEEEVVKEKRETRGRQLVDGLEKEKMNKKSGRCWRRRWRWVKIKRRRRKRKNRRRGGRGDVGERQRGRGERRTSLFDKTPVIYVFSRNQ